MRKVRVSRITAGHIDWMLVAIAVVIRVNMMHVLAIPIWLLINLLVIVKCWLIIELNDWIMLIIEVFAAVAVMMRPHVPTIVEVVSGGSGGGTS